MSLKAVAGFLRRTFVLKPVEQALRRRARLDRRVYDAKLRIRAVTPGALAVSGPHWLVFMIYPSPAAAALAPYHACVFDACRRLGVNEAVVTNATLSAPLRGYVLANSSLLIERENVGHDFGAYKDAIDLLSGRFGPSSHLLLFNDSVAYDPRTIGGLIGRMADAPGFCAVTENVAGVRHGQSYALSFAPAVHRSQAFRSFWSRYRPLSEKAYVVRRGEHGLSLTLEAAGFPVHALWRHDHLAAIVDAGGPAAVAETVRLLSPPLRRKVERAMGAASAPAAARTALLREVLHTDPVRAAGLAYALMCGLPVIKRNLMAKGGFAGEDIDSALARMNHPCRAEIVADLTARAAG